MKAVEDSHAEILALIAWGRVLETGYGTGKSAKALASSCMVESVMSWEPNYEYLPNDTNDKITVVSGDYWPTNGEFDFVFLDHWPLPGETRKEAARHWRSMGAVVVVDDANLEPDLAGEAYKILNMWVMK